MEQAPAAARAFELTGLKHGVFGTTRLFSQGYKGATL
jgi:hypothetical protein